MSIKDLIQTMDQLNQVHESLLELSKLKTNVLIQNQVEQLNQIVNKENNLMKQITKLDHQRIDNISQFLLNKGYKPNAKITVNDLTKLVFKAEEKQALKSTQEKLLGTIEQLKQLNQLNQKLIEQSLAYIDYSMDLVLGPPEDEVVYHNPSLQQNIKRNGMFDRRA